MQVCEKSTDMMLHNIGGSFVLLLFLYSSPSKMETHFSILLITNVDFDCCFDIM